MSTMKQIEGRLLRALEQGEAIHPISVDFKKICVKIQEQAQRASISGKDLRILNEQVARIKYIAFWFKSLTQAGDEALDKVAAVTAEYLRVEGKNIQYNTSARSSNESSGKKASNCYVPSQETLHSKILRHWFLDNIADPFPSKETKKDLVEQTNALATIASPLSSDPNSEASQLKEPMDLQQCSLWFINSRRRSHWTEFFRCYAQSDKDLMRRFMECLRREEDTKESRDDAELRTLLQSLPEAINDEKLQQKIDDCREVYTCMMNWLRQISNVPVGDWMDEVIREAKEEVKQDKIARRSERKRAAEERQRLEEERAAQKAKKREASIKRRRKAARERQAGETLKRKSEREKRGVRRMPLKECRTPDNTLIKPQITGSSTGSSSWAEQYATRRVPSLVASSDGCQPRHCSSSSSSLNSYDNFLPVPSSPTLGILTNGHKPRTKSLSMSPTSQLFYPLADGALSLYAGPSYIISTLPTPTSDHTQQLALPSNEHFEEQLSGGSRSIYSRQPSPAVLKVEQRSMSTSAAPTVPSGQDNSAFKSEFKSVRPRLTI